MTTIPGRCHFDANGWLQGPIQISHMLTPNRYNSGFADHGKGVVFHTEDGFEAGTIATFMSPASKASAFFAVGADGATTQFLPVGQGYCAWAQAAGNDEWRSIEDADGTHPSVPLAGPQMAAFAQILEACSAYDGFPLQITDDVNGTGLITHGDGGIAWGGHFGCPGDVRKAQRPVLIALAKQIRSQGATMAVATDGKTTLHQFAAAHGAVASEVLRMTAVADGLFPAPVASWLNAVFAGTVSASAPMPAKLELQVPRA